MTHDHQHREDARSPRAAATRLELYTAVFIIWVALAFALGEVLRAESSTARLLYWVISLVMVVLYGAISIAMWWRNRGERAEG